MLSRSNFRPTAGAIRWDAWHGELSEVGRAVEKTLSPPQYRFRLPWFAQIKKDGTVSIRGDRADLLETVIAYAWNEHDEGGWLCPTLGVNGKPDTRRVQAVGRMLREYR